MFWLLTFVALAVASVSVSEGVFTLLDRALAATSLNAWGDMEGLMVPVWVLAAALFIVSLVLIVRYVARHSGESGAA